MQPQNQSLLDPDTLMQLASQFEDDQGDQSDPSQSTQNFLQLYKNQSAKATGSNPYGPAPSGMSQSQWNGMCEAWLEQQEYGHTGVFPSAIAAANHYATSGQLKSGLQGAKPGDMLFFGANSGNGNDGHAAKFLGYDQQGNPMMQSATYNGVQNSNVANWNSSVAPLLGYVSMGKK